MDNQTEIEKIHYLEFFFKNGKTFLSLSQDGVELSQAEKEKKHLARCGMQVAIDKLAKLKNEIEKG